MALFEAAPGAEVPGDGGVTARAPLLGTDVPAPGKGAPVTGAAADEGATALPLPVVLDCAAPDDGGATGAVDVVGPAAFDALAVAVASPGAPPASIDSGTGWEISAMKRSGARSSGTSSSFSPLSLA